MVRYGLVATALVPVFDSPPGDNEGLEEKTTEKDGERVEVLESDWGEGIDEKEFPLGEDEDEVPQKDGSKDPEEFGKSIGDVEEEKIEESQYEPTTDEEGDCREDFGLDPQSPPIHEVEAVIEKLARPLKVRHVTIMEPIESRNVAHVLPAMDRIVTRMQYMGICVNRIHSDRAKELLSRRFREWVARRNTLHTFTAGDDPQSNGHCESEVNQLKRRTRLLLHTAGQDPSHWPQAMRYASEERLRNQMSALGSPVSKMLPYNARVLVKRKRWHDQGNLLAQPFVETNLLCPSPDMSSGWLVTTVADQHVLHAREVILPEPLGDQAQIQPEEETNPGKPKYRLWGKQSLGPRFPMHLPLPRDDRGGESLGSKNENEKTEKNENAENGSEPGDVDGNGNADGRDLSHVELDFDSFPTEKAKGLRCVGAGLGQNGKWEETVKTENIEGLEKTLEWKHRQVNGTLQGLLDVVPVNRDVGEFCGETIQWLQNQREGLECDLFCLKELQNNRVVRMCGFQAEQDELPDQGEVLQTTTVSLNEVRANINEWKEAMGKEYRSLVHETRAIEPVMLAELNPEMVEFVPGKLVTVRKAGPQGGKKKCRAVVCGNLLQSDLDPAPGSPYASGADGVLIRAALAHSVQRGWGVELLDVKTVFLLAPRPQPNGSREVIVVPPRILVDGGICSPNERWRVHHALYGFTSSPAHWAIHRDKTMSEFRWETLGSQFYLRKTAEGNLWKIMKQVGETPGEKDSCEGHVIVYVDDIMALAGDDVRASFFGRLQQEWKCSELETVNQKDWVRFCGFEMKRHEDGRSLMISQKSYTAELLKRHEGITPKQCPLPKNDGVETDEENITTEQIRAAQAVTGELLWLSVRSRPDIAYGVSVLSRNVSKRPRWVQQMGRHILGFLEYTKEACIVYRPCSKDHGASGLLQVPRHERLLEAFADISFAPQGDRSHQGIIIFAAGSPIHWEATRQAFHTMSTAESELVGYCEATTMLKSAEALLRVIHGPMLNETPFEKVIYGDNSSALSILMNPDGGWRTRHLRLRSSCLRELLRDEPQNWKVRHQRGVDLPADMLTKPIVLQREWVKFWHFLGFLVDNLGISSKPESGHHDVNSPPHQVDICSGSAETKGSDDANQQVRAVVAIAALTVAATTAAGADVRRACAAAVAACAGWLIISCGVSNYQKVGNPPGVEKEGWEEEETTRKEIRAKGLKKCQDARGNEPANKWESSREHEPEDRKGNPLRENEPRGLKTVSRKAPKIPPRDWCEDFEGKKGCNQKGDSLAVARSNAVGEEFTWAGAKKDCWTSEDLSTREGSSGTAEPPYHCPAGCPTISVPSQFRPSAMGEQSEHVAMAKLAALHVAGNAKKEDPWMKSMFWNPPTARKDSWLMTMIDEGWVVRAHGSGRVRRFHPLHKNVPVDPQHLDGTRVSVGFNSRGAKMIATDMWTDPPSNLWEPKAEWTGWTFLKLKKKEGPIGDDHQGVEAPSGSGGSVMTTGRLPTDHTTEAGTEEMDGLLPWVSIGGVVLDLRSETTAPIMEAQGRSENQGEIRGYARGTVAERGVLVTSQLPISHSEEKLSDEDEWERVSETYSQ